MEQLQRELGNLRVVACWLQAFPRGGETGHPRVSQRISRCMHDTESNRHRGALER